MPLDSRVSILDCIRKGDLSFIAEFALHCPVGPKHSGDAFGCVADIHIFFEKMSAALFIKRYRVEYLRLGVLN